MSHSTSTDRLVYHVQFFRRATAEQIKERLWTELWYTPRAVVRHLPTAAAAMQVAEERVATGAWRDGWLIREAEEPDAEGWLKPGWHVYRMELVPASELGRMASGALAAWLPVAHGSSYRTERMAVSQARTTWRKELGREAVRVSAEAVSLRELVQRRAHTLRESL